MFWRREKLFALVGNRTLHRPVRSQGAIPTTLYRHRINEVICYSVIIQRFIQRFKKEAVDDKSVVHCQFDYFKSSSQPQESFSW